MRCRGDDHKFEPVKVIISILTTYDRFLDYLKVTTSEIS
jgi:hypothetical protein